MSVAVCDASVLVVEDNADSLFTLTNLLSKNIRVKYCNARASGWQLFKLLDTHPNKPIDLILLNIQMPYEDGYSILKRIREIPRLSHTRVVAVTEHIRPQDIARAQAAGFDGFIGKPINSQRFPNQIRRILEGESVWEPV